MTPAELGFGPAEAPSRWVARLPAPRVLILAVAALILTNIPMARYGSGGQPDYVFSSLAVLLALWQIWDHRRFAWAAVTVATAATLLLYGLSSAGVIHTGLPGWWTPITSAADILALAILLSPPIRHWVAKPTKRATGSLTRPSALGRCTPARQNHAFPRRRFVK